MRASININCFDLLQKRLQSYYKIVAHILNKIDRKSVPFKIKKKSKQHLKLPSLQDIKY